MNAPKDTRPFDLEAAKAGAPYACRDGREATILKWDARAHRSPLVGVFGDQDEPNEWGADGKNDPWAEHPQAVDLVMLPLGYISGKPVFWNDELVGPYGERVIVSECGINFERCCWPAPAKVYPETQMSGKDLWDIYFKNDGNSDDSCVALANAVLRHAIDNGQLPTKEAYDQLRADLLAAEESRAAYGMAVAEAVRGAISAITGPGFHVRLADLDLSAIISGVPA